ncbi:hypothetical protein ID866_10476 [Astraeus odoratus]|nr:hypothetical protein ID866_10476 [Astraeus odoratus]
MQGHPSITTQQVSRHGTYCTVYHGTSTMMSSARYSKEQQG